MGELVYAEMIENSNPRDEKHVAEEYFMNMIGNSKEFTGWTLYEQPTINSMKPDFILVHPEKGILIVEVKDWHLNPPQYEEGGYVLGSNGKYIKKDPVHQVTSYKQLLLEYELDSYVEAREVYGARVFSVITPIVYFHGVTLEQAEKFCGPVDRKNCLIWTQNELEEICHGEISNRDHFPPSFFYKSSIFAKEPHRITQKLAEDVHNILQPSDYARERREPFILTREQNQLIPIREGSVRRWGGVAGSGKTIILATKAAEALKKGHKVLFITFNITLRHYIRDLCSQQFGEGNRKLLRSDLTIAHFHGLLKILLTNLNIKAFDNDKEMNIEAYTNLSMKKIFEELQVAGNHLDTYDTILIDEGQDFKGNWIRFLKQFYTAKGELLVMYDEAQSIYEEQGLWITNPKEIEGLGFRGQVGHLSESQRLPQAMTNIIERIGPRIGIESKIKPMSTQMDLFTGVEWRNIDGLVNRNELVLEKIQEILQTGISKVEDIVILTAFENTGIDVVRYLKENAPYRVAHVYDLSGQQSHENRRNEKWKFQPGNGDLKVSSYHSYKGWESSHVILLLEGELDSQNEQSFYNALFIGLTRVNAYSDSRSFTCLNRCRGLDDLAADFQAQQ